MVRLILSLLAIYSTIQTTCDCAEQDTNDDTVPNISFCTDRYPCTDATCDNYYFNLETPLESYN